MTNATDAKAGTLKAEHGDILTAASNAKDASERPWTPHPEPFAEEAQQTWTVDAVRADCLATIM